MKIDSDWTTNDTYTIEPLWNDFGLDSYDGQITFSKVAGKDDPYAMQIEFAESFDSEGNMVVAVKKNVNDVETIVWSWHIWITEYNPYDSDDTNGTTYTIDSDTNGTMLTWMDRNIGALGTPYSTSNNLYYQWGRKDPFTSTATATNAVATIADAVKSPEYFYEGTSSTGIDWCGSDTNWDQCRAYHWRDAKLASMQAASGDKYDTTKSIYDPSPLGFMVPCSINPTPAEWSSPFEFMSSSTWSNEAKGRTYSDTFFPASGFRSSTNGNLYNNGLRGYCWSAAPESSSYAHSLTFKSDEVTPSHTSNRATGFPVRPIKEFKLND